MEAQKPVALGRELHEDDVFSPAPPPPWVTRIASSSRSWGRSWRHPSPNTACPLELPKELPAFQNYETGLARKVSLHFSL